MSLLRSPINAVYFDVVGTVLFPEPSAITIYAEVARRLGLEIPLEVVRSRFIAAYNVEEEIDRQADWATSEVREERRWRNIVATALPDSSLQDSGFQELYQHFARPDSWKLGSDVSVVLTELRTRGLVVGLGSNYDHRLWKVIEGFPELGLLRERTVISSVVGVRKPARKYFEAIVYSAGYPAEQILFVGDDLTNDYWGARAAGLQALLLDPARRFPQTERIDSLLEILKG